MESGIRNERAAAEIDVGRINRSIEVFGTAFVESIRADRRETMQSLLFDVPRRSSIGWDAVYLRGVEFLREACQHATPDELGRRMRTVGCRAYALAPTIVMCGYLGGREQRMLDRGLDARETSTEEAADLAFVTDFWERLVCAYRGDGSLVPGERPSALRIVDQETIETLATELRPRSGSELAVIRRTYAMLEVFNFVVHGEMRDGIFGHGPYELGNGQTIFFKELNDLRNDFLPWAHTADQNLLDNLVVAYAARDVVVSCDLWGTMTVDPHELDGRIEGVALMTNDAGRTRLVTLEELEEAQRLVASVQQELYLRISEWDARYRIAYGAALYANSVKPFLDIAGLGGDASSRLLSVFEGVGEDMVGRYLGAEVPSMWPRLRTVAPADYFSPLTR